jgi:nickel/cobalt transporter (NiCoT) family protein
MFGLIKSSYTVKLVWILVIGTIELLQVFIGVLDLRGRFFDLIAALDFGILGYIVVGIFLVAWSVSAAVCKFGRVEERYSYGDF